MNSSLKMFEPKFLEGPKEFEKFLGANIPGSFNINVTFSEQGKFVNFYGIIDEQQNPFVFSALKYDTNIEGEELAMLDSLVSLCYGAGFSRLNDLSLREIDSFLRLNPLDSFFSCSLNSLYPVFTKVKKALLDRIDTTPVFIPGEKRSPVISIDYVPGDRPIIDELFQKTYIELSENQKNDLIFAVFDKYVTPFLRRDAGGIQLVFCDDFLVVVRYLGSCEFCSRALTTTMDYIQRVVQMETRHSALQIITDS